MIANKSNTTSDMAKGGSYGTWGPLKLLLPNYLQDEDIQQSKHSIRIVIVDPIVHYQLMGPAMPLHN